MGGHLGCSWLLANHLETAFYYLETFIQTFKAPIHLLRKTFQKSF